MTGGRFVGSLSGKRIHRGEKDIAAFRDYENVKKGVREFYRLNHIRTYDFVLQKKNEFLGFSKADAVRMLLIFEPAG
jgi:hypothetical protein